MNSEKAKYFFSMSNIITEEFMGIFYVLSSGQKRMSFGFSSFERSLSFEDCYLGLCLVKDCNLPGFYAFDG